MSIPMAPPTLATDAHKGDAGRVLVVAGSAHDFSPVRIIGGLLGHRGKREPRVRQAEATVTGALDQNIIRRTVRSRLNEVRACYLAALTEDPKLEGRVEIKFVINAAGKVGSAVVEETTVADKEVGKCIAKAVERWKFPKPSEGVVDVLYPFTLTPD